MKLLRGGLSRSGLLGELEKVNYVVVEKRKEVFLEAPVVCSFETAPDLVANEGANTFDVFILKLDK